MSRRLMLVLLVGLVIGIITGSSLINDGYIIKSMLVDVKQAAAEEFFPEGDIPQPKAVHEQRTDRIPMDGDLSGTYFIEQVETDDMNSLKKTMDACPIYNTPVVEIQYTECADAPSGWVRIVGIVHLDGTPLIALVLANGQFMFTNGTEIGDVGDYDLTVPLDANNSIKLFAFVSGMLPYVITFEIDPITCEFVGCGPPGLPLTLYNLSVPIGVSAGEHYDGSVEYQGTFEDIVNPVMLSRFYSPYGGSVIAYTSVAPTASNCTIDFLFPIPYIVGAVTCELKLVDFDDSEDAFYNWDNNAASNTLSETITIH